MTSKVTHHKLSRKTVNVLNKGLNAVRQKGGRKINKNVGKLQHKINRKLNSLQRAHKEKEAQQEKHLFCVYNEREIFTCLSQLIR